LRGAVVTLGQNIKLLVCYLVTILDCSYEQVKTLTNDLYSLTLSDGEITAILQEQAIKWLPEYERLKEEVRAGPGVHVDETTWPIQTFAHHTYAWVMSAVGSLSRVYKLATSRGKGHAIDLLGHNYQGVRITDCFPGYKNMSGLHQICWAHLHRKIRDLLENKNLPEEKQPDVRQWYEQFSVVYGQLREYLSEPFNQTQREQQTTRLRAKIQALRQPDPRDPKKLADLKNLLIEYDHALFTCLQFEGIPCDNNRAERDLRPLVIKRKKSFGSRTEAGARALEILLSVCWSTWHLNRGNFLAALVKLKH
jgi:transposase